MVRGFLLFVAVTLVSCVVSRETTVFAPPELRFDLPQAPASIRGGRAFAASIRDLGLREREAAIYREFMAGNLPEFMRHPVAVRFRDTLQGIPYAVELAVLPDYLCLGRDDDYLLMPMTPMLAQRVMDRIGGMLPTRKLVDIIWDQAKLKLEPQPIPPGPEMVTVQVFEQHNELVGGRRDSLLQAHPLGELVAGHKKDVILANLIESHPRKVIIYGWHHTNGQIIQPVYAGHVNWYADYSHGIRGLTAECIINDSLWQVVDVLQDPVLYRLLSDEAVPLAITRYDTSSANYP